mgnify:CR=1 FL=1
MSTDTTISFWPVAAATSFVVHWRRTDSNQWEHSRWDDRPVVIVTHCRPLPECSAKFPNEERRIVLRGVRVDDWVFGVSSVSKDGFESPVASAVPGGAFKPYVAPPPEPVK